MKLLLFGSRTAGRLNLVPYCRREILIPPKEKNIRNGTISISWTTAAAVETVNDVAYTSKMFGYENNPDFLANSSALPIIQ